MYRQNYLFSLLFTTTLRRKFSGKLQEVSTSNILITRQNTKLTSLVRCLCEQTSSHQKTHQTPDFCQQSPHTTVEFTTNHSHESSHSHKGTSNKASWLMLAGAGLFSYSVWKARQKDLRNPFVVYAAESEQTTDTENISTSSKTKPSRLESNAPRVLQYEQEIPEYVPYLLIGAGTASHSAMRAIRLRDHTAQVLIVGDEDNNPYSRPPLSKELWFGERTGVFYDPKEYYMDPEDLPSTKYGGVAVLKGKKVVKINTDKRIAYLDNGSEIKYDKCLIATGGRPKNLPVFEEADETLKSRVHLFRNIDDFAKLYRVAHTSKSIAVIGGGFLGSELACALSYKGEIREMKVYQIFPEKSVMSKILPEFLSRHATDKIEQGGVDILSGKSVKSAAYKNNQVVLTLTDGSKVEVDDVVVTVGLQPNDELGKTSDLEIDPVRGGLMANPELEVKPNIWVAGDVASFYDYKYGRGRVEHHSHADNMGKIAGENMTGAGQLYEHQPYFWSDLGPESYQAIGEVDSSLETFSVFYKVTVKGRETTDQDTSPNASSQNVGSPVLIPTNDYEGVVFYYKDNQIVGIVLWNVFGKGKVHTARQILKKSKEIKNEDPYELSKLLFQRYKKEPELGVKTENNPAQSGNKVESKPEEQNEQNTS